MDSGPWGVENDRCKQSIQLHSEHDAGRSNGCKSLAGWDRNATSRLPTLADADFDAVVLRPTRLLQVKLFDASQGFADSLSLRDDIVDVLTATAILHYPEMLLHSPESPYIKRVRQALSQVQATEAEIAAWAIVIHRTLQKPEKDSPCSPTPQRTGDDELLRRQTLLLEQQAQLLGGLAADVKELNQLVRRLENPSGADSTQLAPSAAGQPILPPDVACANPARSHSRAKPLASVWYEWFLPPLANARQNRRRHHECKVAVSFMRIFLPMGYNVTGEESDAKGRILSSGREAEANILAFLEAKNIKAKSHGTIVKVLKRMHAEGKLNEHISRYQQLQQEGKVIEGSPLHVLKPCNNQHTM